MGVSPSNRRRNPSGDGPTTIKVTIPSNFIAGREVQRRILEGVEQHHFDTQSAFAIKLALEEGIINAVKHGNKLDASKKVRIEAIISPSQAEIIIEDEGVGFDRKSIPDPTADENLDKCSGRGILLMEAYMDSVEYLKKGRRVRMIKKNSDSRSNSGLS